MLFRSKGTALRRLVLTGLGSLFLSVSLLAHHSFVAEFDESKPIKVTGTVTKVEWQNPHVWFYVDVKDDSGKVANWGFSGGAPGQLMRRGVTRDVIKPGMVIKVEGYRARDGSNNGSGGRVTFADGRSVFTAAAEDKSPK
jgi:hypothetical protein